MLQTYSCTPSSSGRTPLFPLITKALHKNHPGYLCTKAVNHGREAKFLMQMRSRRNFLIRSFVAMLASVYAKQINVGLKKENPRISIIGAGIAGLNAAYVLRQYGYHATVYEASQRTGGRIRTSYGEIASGLATELGGEFIDSTHTDMLALARTLNLPLLDTQTESENKLRTTYFFHNRHYTEEQVIEEFRPIASKIASDAGRLSLNITAKNHSKTDVELDRLSITEYLERIDASGWVRDLIVTAYIAEYGLDADELSCINLLSMINANLESRFHIFGDSDERFKIQGGNQKITDELTKCIGSNIKLEHRLVAMQKNGSGFQLTFLTPGKTLSINTDWLILAIPYTLLRTINTGDVLPPSQLNIVHNLGYGSGSKLISGVNKRIWREQGYSGECYTSEAFQTGWDSSRMQDGSLGSYTYFLGGKAGVNIGNGKIDEYAREFSAAINRVYHGFDMHLTNKNLRIHWSSEPFSLGSYSCFRSGQWTQFNGEVGRQSGNLLFAGEHCSTKFQGFMNGAAETGRLAAQKIISNLG